MKRLTGLRRLRLVPSELERITVCTRPFRASGPRLESESFGGKRLIHNYGHGGSGWSLSWGSASRVVAMALAEGTKEVAVVGCGALGLTSSIALQRAGARVTIYARDLSMQTRSARATGTWTPDARVALKQRISDSFAADWEVLARFSFAAYADLLRLPGSPVELHDRYTVSDLPPTAAWQKKVAEDGIGFARLEERIADLYPAPVDFGPGEHPFSPAFCRQTQGYRFHIAGYTRYLESEFRERGGSLIQQTFQAPADLLTLPQSVIVNCTGYGARALFRDESLIPVRGQISWLPPQPDLPYSIVWEDLNLVPRADGTVVQWGAQGDSTGWADGSEEPDAQEAADALRKAATLYPEEERARSFEPS